MTACSAKPVIKQMSPDTAGRAGLVLGSLDVADVDCSGLSQNSLKLFFWGDSTVFYNIKFNVKLKYSTSNRNQNYLTSSKSQYCRAHNAILEPLTMVEPLLLMKSNNIRMQFYNTNNIKLTPLL